MSPLDFGGEDYAGSGEHEVIPKDTVLTLRLEIERDAANANPASNLFFPSSQPNSNVYFMKWKFVVVNGDHKDSWFRNNQTVQGGTQNGKGQSKGAVVTGRLTRQIIESARGIRSDANDQNSAAARILQNDWADLDGIVFLGKVGVEDASGGYGAKNKLVAGIPPDHKDWFDWHNGPPQAAPPGAPATQAPAIGTAAAPPGAAPANAAGGMGFTPPPAAPAGAPAGAPDGTRPDWAG